MNSETNLTSKTNTQANSSGNDDRIPNDSRRSAQAPDTIDRKLIEALIDDARISISDLASKIGLSRANAYARLSRLRRGGVIKGFSARVDPRALGLEVAALIMISVEQRSWRAARDEILSIREIEYIAYATGDFDFLVLVRVPDVSTLRDVILMGLQSSKHVRSTKTVFVLDEVIRSMPLR